MFLKPFRTKSNVQLKNSEKKKLKSDVKIQYPKISDQVLDDLIPSKGEVIARKIYTHSGDNVIIYFSLQIPIFFSLEKDKKLYPSVYSLWKSEEEFIKCYKTWPHVLKHIGNGADLMLPGVVVDNTLGRDAYGKVAKGDPAGVNLVENRACIAVGYCALSSEDMYMSGNRGKGVIILHCYGDLLWEAGSKERLPSLERLVLNEKAPEVECQVEESNIIIENETSKEDVEEKSLIPLEEENKTNVENSTDDRDYMDSLLKEAFLSSWKTTAKNVELPLLISNFFRVHMVPSVAPRELLIKKSSYKKLTTFLTAMEKEGIIVLKEIQKGVESIVSVDLSHDMIRFHKAQPPNLPDTMNNSKKSIGPIIERHFYINKKVLSIFSPDYPTGFNFTRTQVQKYIKDYVNKEQLQSTMNKKYVNLNPILAAILLRKGENEIEKLEWEDLFSRLFDEMSPGYSIVFPDGTEVIKKGHLDAIKMSTMTRSGNKKVTLIHNLDLYGIDPHEFATKCQVGVAASTSVNIAPQNKKHGCEVLVQGNQVAFIIKLLTEKYGINKNCLSGTELAIKSKKVKK